MLIHTFRPSLAELLNMISFTQMGLNQDTGRISAQNNHDLLYNVLYKMSQCLQLKISAPKMKELIE